MRTKLARSTILAVIASLVATAVALADGAGTAFPK